MSFLDQPDPNDKPLTTSIFAIVFLIVFLITLIHLDTPNPQPLPNTTKTINLIDPTGKTIQTWTYTGPPIAINYQDPKGIGILTNINNQQIIINEQPIHAPIGWYLQIKHEPKPPKN